MASTLLILLLLVSLASASHYYGGHSSFEVHDGNSRGTFQVEFHNKVTFDGCRYSHYWRCYSSNCGSQSRQSSGTIDSSTNAPPRNRQWCETETVQTRNIPSDKPFQMRVLSCCWIPTVNSVGSWRLSMMVDLGKRSDTQQPNMPPDIGTLPLLRVPRNCPRSYRLMVSDPDGDRVRCRYGTVQNVECNRCSQPAGFRLNEGSCELQYSYTSQTGVYGLEMVVEDFPQRPITLAYTDGSRSHRSPLTVRRGKRSYYGTTAMYSWHRQHQSTTTPGPTTSWQWWWHPSIAAAHTTATPYYIATPWQWWRHPTTIVAPRPTTPYYITTPWQWWWHTTTTAAPTTTTPYYTTNPWWRFWHTTTTAAPRTTTPYYPTTPWWWWHTTTAPTTTTAAPITTTPYYTTTPWWWLWHTTTTTAPTTTTAAPTTTTTAPTTTTAAPTTTTPYYTTTPWWWLWHTTTTAAPTTTTAALTTTPPYYTTTPWWWLWHTTTTAAPTTTTAAPTTTPPYYTTTPWWWSTTTSVTTTAAPTTTTRLSSSSGPLTKLPLQFSVLVDAPAPSCRAGDYLPQFLHPTPANGERLHAEANKEVEIRVKARANYATLEGIIISGPLRVTKHRTTHNEFAIRWTPATDDVGDHFPICFAAEAKAGSRVYQSEMRCVLVDVVQDSVKTNVICQESTMTVEVERASLSGIRVDHLRLNDPSNTACSLQSHSNSTHIVAVIPLNSCGTQIEEDDDNLRFKNEITTTDDVNTLITRKHLLEVEFYCQYPKRGNVTLGFTAHRNNVTAWEKGFGTFTYEFEFFHGSSFQRMMDPSTYPLVYDVGERIYMQIEAISSINNTELFVESCRAAPYDNPNYTPTYSIIENGCEVDATTQIHSPNHQNHFSFSMEAFKFIGQHDQVYISCSVMVCEAGNPSTRCSQGCINSTSPYSQHRGKREAVIQTAKHFVSQGPLRLRSSESTATNLNLNLNLVFIAGCLLAAVGMICAVVIYKSKASKIKYQPLPSFEN